MDRERYGQVTHAIDIRANRLREADDDTKAAVAFEDLAGETTPERRGDDLLGVLSRQAVAGQRFAVEVDGKQRQSRDLLDLHVRRTRNLPEDRFDPFRRSEHHLQVIAIDLDGHICAHARDEFIEAHLNRLGELIVISRNCLQGGLELADELRLGLMRVGPLVPRLQHHIGVGDARGHRIGGDLGRTDLTEDLVDFGELLQAGLEDRLHLDSLREARPGDAQGMEGDIPLVEAGHELAA